MCWHGIFNPRIATKDIPILKVVLKGESKYLPYFENDGHFFYEKGKIASSRISSTINECLLENNIEMIGEALHSYSIDIIVKEDNYRISIINDGYHLQTYIKDRIWNFPTSLVKGYIPRGSIYCVNEVGEYISNHLVLE